MPWNPDFGLSDAPRQSAFDPFRTRLVELVLDGVVVGHLATQVNAASETVHGRLWWKKWEPPFEYLEICLTALAAESSLPEEDDPWWFVPKHASELDALRSGRFIWPDQRNEVNSIEYQVRWLDESERQKRWTKFGPTDPPIGTLLHRRGEAPL